LKSCFAFVLLNGLALAEIPITARLLERFNPKWALGIGAALIGIGDFWMAAISATNRSIPVVVPPLFLIGVGFGFAVSAVTAVAVNTVPNQLTGMASGSTSMLRDFGFTLGPAIVGAVALSRAANEIQAKLAASPSLRQALDTFNASPSHVPAAQRPEVEAAVGAVNSGPLGANAVPAAVNPLHDTAFHALDKAYSVGYVVCGVVAFIAAILAVAALPGRTHETLMNEESLS
jgi:MFS family permease